MHEPHSPAETERRPLRNWPVRSTSRVQIWVFGIFGLGLAIGTYFGAQKLAAGGFKFRHPDAPKVGWAVVGIGVTLALLCLHGSFGAWLRRAATKARHARHPHEPWRADFARGGVTRDDTLSRLLRAWLILPVLLLFTAATVYALTTLGSDWIGRIVVGTFAFFFSVGLIFAAGNAVVQLARVLRHSRATLRPDHYPTYAGSNLSLRLELPRTLHGATELTARLLCVEEVQEVRETSEGKEYRTVCYVLHEHAAVLSEADLRATGASLRLKFPIPEDAPSTQKHGTPLRYWVLECTAKRPGPDWKAAFDVPIYHRHKRVGWG